MRGFEQNIEKKIFESFRLCEGLGDHWHSEFIGRSKLWVSNINGTMSQSKIEIYWGRSRLIVHRYTAWKQGCIFFVLLVYSYL